MKKRLVILGSTGSIGVQTLDLVARHPNRFTVRGLVAGKKIEILARQIIQFRPEAVSVQEAPDVSVLQKTLESLQYSGKVEILSGEAGASQIASMESVDLVVSGLVGAAGLLPTYKAIEKGRVLALANKESLVIAGAVMTSKAKQCGAVLLPVDSEHSAVFQSLSGSRHEDLKRIILTASGGPFFKTPMKDLESVTVEQALKHPNWSMGPKITIDSATMMNKGLEVIEASWLFDVPPSRIDVVIHPQSIVHSMVEFIDGSVIAQMGVPDMRCPIAYALAYPERIESGVKSLSLTDCRSLDFFEPDFSKFKALKLATQAMEAGGSMPAVLNAANEVAVACFLQRKIPFLKIAVLIEKTLSEHSAFALKSLEDVVAADRWGRERASQLEV